MTLRSHRVLVADRMEPPRIPRPSAEKGVDLIVCNDQLIYRTVGSGIDESDHPKSINDSLIKKRTGVRNRRFYQVLVAA